jgi:hypothetical protein
VSCPSLSSSWKPRESPGWKWGEEKKRRELGAGLRQQPEEREASWADGGGTAESRQRSSAVAWQPVRRGVRTEARSQSGRPGRTIPVCVWGRSFPFPPRPGDLRPSGGHRTSRASLSIPVRRAAPKRPLWSPRVAGFPTTGRGPHCGPGSKLSAAPHFAGGAGHAQYRLQVNCGSAPVGRMVPARPLRTLSQVRTPRSREASSALAQRVGREAHSSLPRYLAAFSKAERPRRAAPPHRNAARGVLAGSPTCPLPLSRHCPQGVLLHTCLPLSRTSGVELRIHVVLLPPTEV